MSRRKSWQRRVFREREREKEEEFFEEQGQRGGIVLISDQKIHDKSIKELVREGKVATNLKF